MADHWTRRWGRDALASLHRRLAEMQVDAAQPARRGTRRRAVPLMAAGTGVLGVFLAMVSANVMAVNFTTGNSEFKLYSNYLDAEQAAAFLATSTKQNGSQEGLADLGIVTAKLAGLCIIQTESIGALGSYSFMISAGETIPDTYDGSTIPSGVDVNATNGKLQNASLTNAVKANNLFLNADSIGANGNKISGLNLGQSADTVGTSAGLTWPGSPQQAPVAGNFGLYAQQLNLAGLGGKSYGLNLQGAITLPKLNLRVVPGAKTQADCS